MTGDMVRQKSCFSKIARKKNFKFQNRIWDFFPAPPPALKSMDSLFLRVFSS